MLQDNAALDVRLAQLDRAFGYGPKGRGFESSNARDICVGVSVIVRLRIFCFEKDSRRIRQLKAIFIA